MKVTVKCAACRGEFSGMCRECNGWGVVEMHHSESVGYVNEMLLGDLDAYVEEILEAYDPDEDVIPKSEFDRILKDLECISMIEAHEWLAKLKKRHLILYWLITDEIKSRATSS